MAARLPDRVTGVDRTWVGVVALLGLSRLTLAGGIARRLPV